MPQRMSTSEPTKKLLHKCGSRLSPAALGGSPISVVNVICIIIIDY